MVLAHLKALETRGDAGSRHAWKLRLEHPATGKPLEIEAPLPRELEDLLGALPL